MAYAGTGKKPIQMYFNQCENKWQSILYLTTSSGGKIQQVEKGRLKKEDDVNFFRTTDPFNPFVSVIHVGL